MKIKFPVKYTFIDARSQYLSLFKKHFIFTRYEPKCLIFVHTKLPQTWIFWVGGLIITGKPQQSKLLNKIFHALPLAPSPQL